MRDQARTYSRLVAGAALAALTACGGGGSNDPNPVAATPAPTPTPCTQSTVLQDAGGIPARTLVYDDFSVPSSGRLDVTLDWTFPDSQIGFYIVPVNTCTLSEFNAGSCNFLIRSETKTKPRKISTANFAAGNYRWMVGNYAQKDESVSMLIQLSSSGCPPLASAPAASASAATPAPQLERVQRR